jgi:hypothetical protein
VKLDAAGVTASISIDNGLTWQPAPLPDLTPMVSGRYSYLLRLDSTGEKSVVRSMEVTTWVQVHPASLPSLRKGKNEMQYVTGDHYGLNGQCGDPHQRQRPADFLKFLQEPPADFDPARTSGRVRGPFTVKVTAPPGHEDRLVLGRRNFTAHQGGAAPQTKNSMAWAADEPRDFKEFYRADVPAGQSHWHYNADVEVKLDAPAKVVYVRYVGDPGVNNVRLFAHCVEEAPQMPSPVRITHAWREKGELKTKTVRLERPGAYEVTTDEDPVDESVEIAVPGGPTR